MSNLSKYIKKSDIKCPICQTLLDVSIMSDKVFGCPKCRNMGNIDLWQELIRTRKELEQSETCCTEWEKQALDYKAENIALSGDLERTRKALDVAVEGITYMRNNCLPYAADYMDKADDILNQIKSIKQ